MQVYIDAGHGRNARGGADPGAVGPSGLTENAVVVDLARRVGHLLREKGHQTAGVALNGPDTESLVDAVRNAAAWGADVFVSIHCNAAADPRAGGIEVLFKSAKSKTVAQRVLNQLNNVLSGNSRWWRHPTSIKNRGLKFRDDLHVLKQPIPAILVENLFISNPAEERLLKTPEFLQGLAQAIADGVIG